MTSDRWSEFGAILDRLADSYGKRIPESQARRWWESCQGLDLAVLRSAADQLSETSGTMPGLPRLLEVYRSLRGDTGRCAACNGAGVVFTRNPGDRPPLADAWHGKVPVECSCRQGRPHRHDPALPGNPGCACGGRGWMPYPSREAIPEGREYLGPMLSGRVMASCPCKRPEYPDEVQREVLTPELDLEHELDVVSRGWLA